MNALARGVYVAALTPMHQDQTVNGDELRRQASRFVAAGVDAIFCLGTNGEFYALEYAEKLGVLQTVVDEVSGKVPVCAGVGCVTTAETVRLAREAERVGVQALSVITPYFAPLSQDELHAHYAAVAAATQLPIILYNIPQRTGNTIEPATANRLAAIPNIAGVKDSSGKLESIAAFVERTPRDFAVFAGTDSLILGALRKGAAGTVSGLANIAPEVVVRIYRAFQAGDLQAAEQAQQRLALLRGAVSLGNPGSIIKRAVNLLGHPVGPCRAPVESGSAELDEAIKRTLAQAQLAPA